MLGEFVSCHQFARHRSFMFIQLVNRSCGLVHNFFKANCRRCSAIKSTANSNIWMKGGGLLTRCGGLTGCVCVRACVCALCVCVICVCVRARAAACRIGLVFRYRQAIVQTGKRFGVDIQFSDISEASPMQASTFLCALPCLGRKLH